MSEKSKEKGVSFGALIFFLALATLILIVSTPLLIIILVVLVFGKPITFKPGEQEMNYNPAILYKIPLTSGQVRFGRQLREDGGLLHFQATDGTWQTLKMESIWTNRIHPSTR
jgi:hypothetical protein